MFNPWNGSKGKLSLHGGPRRFTTESKYLWLHFLLAEVRVMYYLWPSSTLLEWALSSVHGICLSSHEENRSSVMMTYELDNKSIAGTLLLIAPLSGLMKMWESSGNLQRGPLGEQWWIYWGPFDYMGGTTYLWAARLEGLQLNFAGWFVTTPPS